MNHPRTSRGPVRAESANQLNVKSRAKCATVTAVAHGHRHGGRPRTPRRPGVRSHAGYTRSIVTSCKRKPFGAPGCIPIRLHDYYGNARARHLRRRSRRKPAASCGTRASSMHGIRNMQLAGSPAAANRPAEAALFLRVTCDDLDALLPSEMRRIWEN